MLNWAMLLENSLPENHKLLEAWQNEPILEDSLWIFILFRSLAEWNISYCSIVNTHQNYQAYIVSWVPEGC